MKTRPRTDDGLQFWHASGRVLACALLLMSASLSADSLAADAPARLADIPNLVHSAVGVTRQGMPIECWLHREDLDLHSNKFRILLIGGLAGDPDSADRVRAALHWFYTDAAAAGWRDRFLISAVPAANPEGIAARSPTNSVGGDPTRGYPPPEKGSYDSPTNPEAHYLWRWIGMHAPDLVIDVRGKPSQTGDVLESGPGPLQPLITRLQLGSTRYAADELTVQLGQQAPSETGTVPALKLVAADTRFLETLLNGLAELPGELSPARGELQRRLARSPRDVAEELTRFYGHALPDVAYIPAVALIGRLRYGELAQDPSHRTDVERIVGPYFRGEKVCNITNGSLQSGHLIFCELADRSSGETRARYVELAKRAADQAFDEQGQPREAMPFHLEMSDSLFMGGPILAYVGSLTNEPRYFDACLRHLRFMRGKCLRADGLYRHSPLDEAAWGRGNGFPALGVAWCLAKFPPDHPQRGELLSWFRVHMQALLPHQDPTGCWHQVIDHPESYRELTATCMVGFAMSRGVREGWLDRETFQPAIDRAWYAVNTRVGKQGRLVDVCTGTGKQKSLRDYYDRPAILGPDDRGGAMSLLFATERSIP